MHDKYVDTNVFNAGICDEWDMLIEFAKMSIGVSCVVKQFVEDELKIGSLIEITLSNSIPACEIGFLYNNIQPFNENILKFIKMEY